MKKKTKLMLLLFWGIFTLMCFIGCNNNAGDTIENNTNPTNAPSSGNGNTKKPEAGDTGKTVLDLRVKKDGVSYFARAAEDDIEFSYGLLLQDGCDDKWKNVFDSEEELENALKLYDDETGGLSFEFQSPQNEECILVQIVYVDGNGNWSTCASYNDNDFSNNTYGKGNTVSARYPFLMSGKEAKLAFQFYFDDSTSFQRVWTVMPKHGFGVVDDLPFGYKTVNSSFENGIVKIKDVILPETDILCKNQVFVYTNEEDIWSKNICYNEFKIPATNGEANEYVIDYNEIFDDVDKDYPYCLAHIVFHYKVDGFEGEFSTPMLESPMVENKWFKPIPEDQKKKIDELECDNGIKFCFNYPIKKDTEISFNIYNDEDEKMGYYWEKTSADIENFSYEFPFVDSGKTYTVDLRIGSASYSKAITAKSGFGEIKILNLDAMQIKVDAENSNKITFSCAPEFNIDDLSSKFSSMYFSCNLWQIDCYGTLHFDENEMTDWLDMSGSTAESKNVNASFTLQVQMPNGEIYGTITFERVVTYTKKQE